MSDEIKRDFNVKVKTIVADFTQTDIYEDIADELRNLDIGVLINNVGILNSLGPFHMVASP